MGRRCTGDPACDPSSGGRRTGTPPRDLINAMVHEGRKTFAQADPEVSEAIDFARYYGDRARDLDELEHVSFSPFGVMAVIPPWNFPVAIPAGE